MAKLSKRSKAQAEIVEFGSVYPIDVALALVNELAAV
jgi:hypothetical protein